MSLMPWAHLQMVLYRVTRMASGTWNLGAPGLAYWLRTGLPVWSATAAASKNSSAAGVAMTWKVRELGPAEVGQRPRPSDLHEVLQLGFRMGPALLEARR